MEFRYERNEAAYRRLIAAGRATDYAGRSFEYFDLRPFLERALANMTFSSHRPRALEYGTGTGPGACFLAARGFAVDAIDISPAAIALARRFAQERGLEVSFSVCDVRRMPRSGVRYDLVVDNFCLQHLVGEADRSRALRMVRERLEPGGYFVVGTVLFRTSRDFGADRFDPSTGVVLRRVSSGDDGIPPEAYEDTVRLGSEWFVRWRRLVLSPESLRAELEQAGFRVTLQDGARCLCVPAPGG